MRQAVPTLFLAGALAFAAIPSASAQGRPCADPDYHAFDFWTGDWIAYDRTTNRELGRDTVDRFLDGCVILENWVGASGFNGTSLNVYDIADGKWHQTWTDNQGGLTFLEGGIQDGKMVMEGTVPNPDAPDHRGKIRITWQTAPQGGVREVGERSIDGGASWEPDFDIVYAPNKLAPATDAPAGQAPAGTTP
jgi:hypothetical protein